MRRMRRLYLAWLSIIKISLPYSCERTPRYGDRTENHAKHALEIQEYGQTRQADHGQQTIAWTWYDWMVMVIELVNWRLCGNNMG